MRYAVFYRGILLEREREMEGFQLFQSPKSIEAYKFERGHLRQEKPLKRSKKVSIRLLAWGHKRDNYIIVWS